MLSPTSPTVFISQSRPKMGDQPEVISVVDVYDLASNIGKEFEIIIDHHGPEAVTSLMPKVIRSLENLEILANCTERENNEIADLKLAVQQLEREKAAKAEERLRYEQELEQIEDTWRTEAKDLMNMVSKLQEENRRLSSALSEQERLAAHQKSRDEEIKLMKKLKDTVDHQREQIRVLKKENQQKGVDVDALQAQLERIAKVNAELRRKQTIRAKQARQLIEEKADLQTQLQDKEQQIQKIKDHLEKESAESTASTTPTSPVDELERFEERLNLEGKMVVDLKDPNRPRFTLNELREVLLERNELKTKLIEVEEELTVYRPKSKQEADTELSIQISNSANTVIKCEQPTYMEAEEDLPVQGPINKEPYEKLYPGMKREESGIRKFFRNLFGSSPKTKASPSSRKYSLNVERKAPKTDDGRQRSATTSVIKGTRSNPGSRRGSSNSLQSSPALVFPPEAVAELSNSTM